MAEYKPTEFIIATGKPEYQKGEYKWNVPIEKREEIVRCRDCRHYTEWLQQLMTSDWCDEFKCAVNPNGFCAWAKRKEVER